MTLSPHERQLKANNPYARGMPMFKHSFEIPNIGQVQEMSNWLAEYAPKFSIYPVTDIQMIDGLRTAIPTLLIAFDGNDELASMFALRWVNEGN